MSRIAIIGSGPAGCYLTEQLLRLLPAAKIDLIERLPVPFGLVRYGVAPDHQGTKAVVRVFERTLSRDRVGFFGNVEVGRDVSLDELRAMYDVVVLATGAARDRSLGVPGENLAGVLGSGEFVRWYNGHPEARARELNGVRSAVIVGNGNVALDVARILAKERSELAGSDLPPHVSDELCSSPIEQIHIVGRRSAAEARFSTHELQEFSSLQGANVVIERPELIAGDSPLENILRSLAGQVRPEPRVSIHFHFQLEPVAFLGGESLEAVRFRGHDRREREIPAQLALTCIGYQSAPCGSAIPVNGAFVHEDGRIEPGLYVVGWAGRGSSGTIPTNRAEAQAVAHKIAHEERASEGGKISGLAEMLRLRKVRWVDYPGWKRIEAAELAGACDLRCRLKITSLKGMLEAADGQPERASFVQAEDSERVSAEEANPRPRPENHVD